MINDIKIKLKNEYLIKLNKKKQKANELYNKILSEHNELKEIEEEISNVACNKILAMIEYNTTTDSKEFNNTIDDLKLKKMMYLKEHNLPLNYDKPKYDCRLCNDTGYVDTNTCICFKQELAKRLFIQNYTIDVNHVDLDSYSFEIFKDESQKNKMKNHLNCIKDYFNNIKENKHENLIIFGDNGLGKTHMLTALCNSLIKEGKLVIYQSAPVILERVIQDKFSNEESTIDKVIRDCDLLIIDDLGKEHVTDYSKSHIFNIINERYNHNKSIAISTNLNLTEFDEKYGSAIQSRLIENSTLFEFIGKNLRYIND